VAGGPSPLWILKISAKKVVFLVSSGKTKFHHFWPPLVKILEEYPGGPPLEKILLTPMLTTLL